MKFVEVEIVGDSGAVDLTKVNASSVRSISQGWLEQQDSSICFLRLIGKRDSILLKGSPDDIAAKFGNLVRIDLQHFNGFKWLPYYGYVNPAAVTLVRPARRNNVTIEFCDSTELNTPCPPDF